MTVAKLIIELQQLDESLEVMVAFEVGNTTYQGILEGVLQADDGDNWVYLTAGDEK